MQEIILEDIKIYAYHGCLPEENSIGTWYNINLYLIADLEKAGQTDDLQYTVNYAELYDIIQKRMAKKSNLLETICYDILKEIENLSSLISSAKIKVSKLSPPMHGNIKSASVVFSKKFK